MRFAVGGSFCLSLGATNWVGSECEGCGLGIRGQRMQVFTGWVLRDIEFGVAALGFKFRHLTVHHAKQESAAFRKAA